MGWTIDSTDRFEKKLRKLDPQSRRRVIQFLKSIRIENADAIQPNFIYLSNRPEFGRFRVGTLRVLARVDRDEEAMILYDIGPRENFYR